MSIQPVVAVGVDPHAETLSAAAVDRLGGLIWETTVPNTAEGIATLIGGTNGELWAIEGSGALGRLLADTLRDRNVRVAEVPTRLTARLRTRGGFSKSDRIDALAIARLALVESLPPVDHQPIIEALRVLYRQRESLVQTQVEAVNRIRARLRELNTVPRLGRLRSRRQIETIIRNLPTGETDPHHKALILSIRLQAEEALQRIDRIRLLETELANTLPPAGTRLTELPGIGLITATAIIVATGDIRRFPTEGHYARYAGAAPLDASSGRQQRHRLNRWGNRSLNHALHTAIVTQIQQGGPAAHYVTRRLQEGKTKKEAIRAAKTHLARHIYRLLKNLT